MPVGDFKNFGTVAPATIDGVELELLLNELTEEIGVQAEKTEDERNLYIGEPTLKQTVTVRTVGMEFKPDGQGGNGNPDLQHMPTFSLALTAPDREVLATGLKQRDWEEGCTSNDVRSNTAEAMAAYKRLWRKCITQSKLALNGWYNATMTPPPFDGVTFASSHTHYLARNAGSTPTQNICVDAALHITEHGYSAESIISEVNQYTLANLVKKGELMQTANDFSIASPILQKMQEMGLRSEYTLGGVPLFVNNFIPNGYQWFGSLERAPMAARRPINDDLGLTSYPQVIIPNTDMRWVGEFSCWAVIPDIVELGAGVAVWLADAGNTGVYTAPADLVSLV